MLIDSSVKNLQLMLSFMFRAKAVGALIGLILGIGIITPVQAKFFHIDPSTQVVGDIQVITIKPGDTFESIARKYDVPYLDLLRANPEQDERVALLPWHKLTIPGRYILPPGPREGLVINLPELKLYYYLSSREVMIVPIGIGRGGWLTPTGETEITMKIPHPSWTPGPDVREDAEAKGIKLPGVMPPGPNNPLGDYVMLLGWKTFLIHSTNRPDGVGKRSSAGCFRLYPEDMELLFELVSKGDKVRVINRPVKMGWHGDSLYIQSYPELDDYPRETDRVDIVDAIHDEEDHYKLPISWEHVFKLIKDSTGLPALIGQRFVIHIQTEKSPYQPELSFLLLNRYALTSIPTPIPQKTWYSPLKLEG